MQLPERLGVADSVPLLVEDELAIFFCERTRRPALQKIEDALRGPAKPHTSRRGDKRRIDQDRVI